jgi:DNA-binding transcriptional regulator YhcF (GntR family)
MARYREIYEDLRRRVLSGEFPVGERLPSIADLQQHYEVPGLNTIRQAQQLLVDDGLVETRQGVGAFVLRTDPQPRPVDVVAELRAARTAIDRALAALDATKPRPNPATYHCPEHPEWTGSDREAMLEHVATVPHDPHEPSNGIITFKITRPHATLPEADYCQVGPTH